MPNQIRDEEDIRWYARLELRMATKDDSGVKHTWVKFEQITEDCNMTSVLSYGINETKLCRKKYLRPSLVSFFPEDPAVIFLCLDHKDTVMRNEYVVDLRCGVVVGKRNVVNQVVVVT